MEGKEKCVNLPQIEWLKKEKMCENIPKIEMLTENENLDFFHKLKCGRKRNMWKSSINRNVEDDFISEYIYEICLTGGMRKI